MCTTSPDLSLNHNPHDDYYRDRIAMFWQQMVNAINLGAMYSLLTIGYTMVYGIIKLINFARGEIFMCGSNSWLLLKPPFLGSKIPI